MRSPQHRHIFPTFICSSIQTAQGPSQTRDAPGLQLSTTDLHADCPSLPYDAFGLDGPGGRGLSQ